jgi:D-sedoheptulose 7-phosphate isomerase
MTDPSRVAQLYQAAFEEHERVVGDTRQALAQPFAALVETCRASLAQGGKLLLFGNGGSAADAQHIATELAVRYSRERRALAAIALTTDTSLLTAAGNDLGFDRIFARQIEALGRGGDVALGLSTSGRSPNVLLALREARERGLVTAAWTGSGGGALREVVEHCLMVPSMVTARIQEMHITLGHLLCQALEVELGLVPR